MSDQHTNCTCPICAPALWAAGIKGSFQPIEGGISWSPDYKSEKPKVQYTFRPPGDVKASYELVKAGTTVELHEKVKDLEREKVELKAEIDRLKDVIFKAYQSDRYDQTDEILDNEIQSWPESK